MPYYCKHQGKHISVSHDYGFGIDEVWGLGHRLAASHGGEVYALREARQLVRETLDEIEARLKSVECPEW